MQIYFYDLNVNKHDPLAEQRIVKSGKLTHLAFNTKTPILLVGDDHGCVTCLKLSPNLRRNMDKPPKKEQEIDNLDKLIAHAAKNDVGW